MHCAKTLNSQQLRKSLYRSSMPMYADGHNNVTCMDAINPFTIIPRIYSVISVTPAMHIGGVKAVSHPKLAPKPRPAPAVVHRRSSTVVHVAPSLTFLTLVGLNILTINLLTGSTVFAMRIRFSNRRLPAELTDIIIDHLHNDKRSLAACSLVCKEWRSSSRYHLFANLNLTPTKARDPEFLASAPKVIPFINHLHLDYRSLGFPGSWNQTFPALVGFDSIKSLTLTFSSWNPLDLEARSALVKQFPNIVRLQLNRLLANQFSELADFVCSFECLETLVADAPEWAVIDSPPATLRLPRNLHALALGSCEKDVVLGWLVSFNDPPIFRRIYLTTLRGSAIQDLSKLLKAVGPCLEDFGCTADDGPRFIDLCHNTRLRSLMAHAFVTDASGVIQMISQISSSDLAKLSLTVNPRSLSRTALPDVDGWNVLDTMLSRAQFSSLKVLEIYPVRDRSLDVRSWLITQMPQCFRRGILYFVKSPLRIPLL